MSDTKKMHYFNWIFIILSLLVVSGCQNSASDKRPQYADVSSSSDKVQSVEVVYPRKRSFATEKLITGTAMPNKKVTIYPMESGSVIEIPKDIGDWVRKGELIAHMQNPVISQLVADARAGVEIARAMLLKSKLELNAAEANSKTKSSIYNRLDQVYDKTPQLTPISEVEKAEAEAQVALAEVELKKAEIHVNEIKLNALEDQLRTAEMRKALLEVRAPFSGHISKRFVDIGAMLQSGLNQNDPQPIVELQQSDPIRLLIPMPESDVGAVRTGLHVDVSFPEIPGQSFPARIDRIANALDPASKTMQVEIDIENRDGKILSGMYAKALFRAHSREDVLSLPVNAQVMHQNQHFIWMVEDSIVHQIQLVKGLSNKDYFEVMNPEISEKSIVIVQGKGLVKPGQIVNPIIK